MKGSTSVIGIAVICWLAGCGSSSPGGNGDADANTSTQPDAAAELVVTTVAGTGEPSFADGAGASAKLNGPMGLVAVGNRVFVADEMNHRIRMLECAGTECTVSTIAGTGTPGFTNGDGATAQFNHPIDIAVNPAGEFLVVDYSNTRIRKIACTGTPSPATCMVSTFAGSGVTGSDNGDAATATFSGPSGVAVSSDNITYIADTNNQKIRRIVCSGTCTVDTLAGTGGLGYQDGAADTAMFSVPIDVAVDSTGAVYVPEWLNMRVRKIAGGMVSTFAGSGLEDYMDGPQATAAFAHPRALTIDTSNRVWVADQGNHRIRLIADGATATLAGSGMTGPPDFGGGGFADGPAMSAMFLSPRGIAIDASGNVYVSDTDNHRIRILRYQ
ncbi:MAG: hypothetical protein AB7O24_13755 [Kofleriaceae bacterium]